MLLDQGNMILDSEIDKYTNMAIACDLVLLIVIMTMLFDYTSKYILYSSFTKGILIIFSTFIVNSSLFFTERAILLAFEKGKFGASSSV